MWLHASRTAALIRARSLSPVELVEAYLDRIDQLDGTLHAYITVCRDDALEAARAAERAVDRDQVGPLHGLPIAVKDQFHIRGVRTTAGSRVLGDLVSAEDATVVARLRKAGAIVLGTLNLSEFALGGTLAPPFGQPRNPWDLARDPGGSSSGSGIATAAALAAATLGEDTGGSIRGPASWCGVVGLRPTWGRVSRAGTIPVSWSMDTAGPLARSVEDCALLLGVIAGPDPRDVLTSRRPVPDYVSALTGDASGLTIGIIRELQSSPDTDAEVRAATAEAASRLSTLGASVEETSLPLLPLAGAVFMALADSEAAGLHRRRLGERPQEYDPGTRRRLLTASLLPSSLYHQADRARALIRRQILDALGRYDVLLAPTAPRPAPLIAALAAPLESRQEAAQRFFARRSYTTPASLAGVPALSVPCGFTTSGLPIGLQLIGRPFEEATLLRAGHAYEQATAWHERQPTL
ncbi:MAG: Asp-tRNA(Asn)/Glu-tRNA(Gln) amidotransferase subunit GatA [Candidatus Rokuibacteriota bacterium]|nr:MAG: Asp-tRNA(Asn)/Glu-tRNA(Gln) amidotransferase subunit GatA [Candidatus Rokubacteria bacterium]